MNVLAGILLVMVAGLGTGTIAWPMKRMRRLEFEHYWFIGMLVGLVIIPWAVVLATVPDPSAVYAAVGWRPLLIGNLFAIGWGIANVLYGVCVVRIGAALTGAIMTGLGLTVGVTLPLIFKGTGLFQDAPDLLSPAGIAILFGVAIMLIGVYFTSMAGFGRDRVLRGAQEAGRQASSGFASGLILVIVAGVLSAGISLTFVYSQGPIQAAVEEQGGGLVARNMAVWAAALTGGALVNLLYPAYEMTRKKNWNLLFSHGGDVVLAAILGTQFIVAVTLMGRGMLVLGVGGAAIGFGIQQAMQIMGNQLVGFASGEWRGVLGKPRTLMYSGLAVLIVAVVVLAFSKSLQA